MTFKHDINVASRSFFISQVGDDGESGLSLENALSTWAEALTKLNALSPPPGLTPDNTAILSQGAGNYLEGDLVIPEGCQVNAPNAIITALTGDGVTPGAGAVFTVAAVIAVAAAKSAIIIDGETLVGVRALAGRTLGAGGTIVDLSGVCDQLFITVDQMVISGVGSVGLLNGCDTNAPVTIRLAEIILSDEDTVGIRHDHASLNLMRSVIQAGTIIPSVPPPTGTIGLDILKGHCDAMVVSIECETAIHVASGAVLDITCASVEGDIIVDSGGTLNCLITEHHAGGTVTNNGTIIGRIGVDFYSPIKPSRMFAHFQANVGTQGTAQGVWAPINATVVMEKDIDFSVSGVRITYTGARTKLFDLSWAVSGKLTMAANQVISTRVRKSTGVLASRASETYSVQTNGTLGMNLLVELAQNEWIEFEATNTSSGGDFVMQELTATMVEIQQPLQ